MKPLTTSVYTFADLIEGGYLYVDKTAGIHRLIAEAKGQYFLSRPRRFGKSLLVSTLKAIFQGRRELFAGLALERLPYDWQPYPVIHLDLGSCQAATPAELERHLGYAVEDNAKAHGLTLEREGVAARFRELVEALGARGKVVILIDEYDKPLLGALGDAAKARELLPVLKGFYSVIKTTEAQQRFVLLTGVSKFSKVSVFSDLNNLTDLTMSRDAATLLGYTQAELEANFPEYLERLAAREGQTREQILARLRDWYNGYRFEESAETVYNPVSVGRCLADEKFKNYWFETGTPAFLVDLVRQQAATVAEVIGAEVDENAFSTYDVTNLRLLALLVQTGYLTIQAFDRETRIYRLGYPNAEVRESFSRCLLEAYAQQPYALTVSHEQQVIRGLQTGDLEAVRTSLRVFFANVPYDLHLPHEKYYQSIFHVLFTLVGLRVACEVHTARGRLDAVIETRERVYVFEFKLKGSAAAALKQIRTLGYHEKYLGQGKEVLLVGAAFSPKTRNLGKWAVARLAATPRRAP